MKLGKSRIHLFILLFAVSSLLVHSPSDFDAYAAADTWTDATTTDVGTNNMYGVSMGDASNGVAVGNSGQIVFTTNGGVDWTDATTTDVGATHMYGVSMIDASNGVAVGYTGQIVFTGTGTPSQVGTASTTAENEQVTLSWSAPAAGDSDITDYIIQYSTDDSTWSTFADGTSTDTTATVTGLSGGTTYYFRVAAVNSLGTGDFSSSSSVSVTSSSSSSSSCYDCEAPKLTKVEVHVSSSPFDYVWNFDQKSPYPMFEDPITPIIADPGDEVEIILELTDNRTLERIADSGTYTNFLTKPDDMNTFYANNFDEYGKVSTTYYQWHQTGEDLVYDYDNTVQWSPADVTIEESGEFVEDGPAENLDGLVGTFTISFKMKFLQPMQTTDVWVQATDRSGNFFKVALPLTLKISGNEPLLFESKIH